MAIRLHDGSFACSICGEKYSQSSRADGCRDSHDMIYIPMSKDELNKLIHAIVMDDTSILPTNLLQTLQKYARQQVIREAQDETIRNSI